MCRHKVSYFQFQICEKQWKAVTGNMTSTKNIRPTLAGHHHTHLSESALFKSDGGELWTCVYVPLRSHLLRTQSSKVLPLKPRLGQYIAMHAMPTAKNFFPADFYLPSPFTFIFSSISPKVFLCNAGSWVGPQNKIGHPAHCYRWLMKVPMFECP